MQLGAAFEEACVHGVEGRHLGDLLDAGQVLRLGWVNQQDPESQTQVNDGSDKGKVKKETDNTTFPYFLFFAKIDYKLPDLEEEGEEHEEEDDSRPFCVVVIPQLVEGEEVRSDVGSRNHRVPHDVERSAF